MPDAIFEHPRLVAIYDALGPDRSDLAVYTDIVALVGARRVLDVGCGTGTFALLLAARGLEVTAVDRAGGSLRVARAKPGAERVRWIHGDTTALPPMRADLATMTANVARERDEVEAALRAHDYVVEDVRHAPDGPGRELVFLARRL
jgi:SAM-dependent methyltransferase